MEINDSGSEEWNDAERLGVGGHKVRKENAKEFFLYFRENLEVKSWTKPNIIEIIIGKWSKYAMDGIINPSSSLFPFLLLPLQLDLRLLLLLLPTTFLFFFFLTT